MLTLLKCYFISNLWDGCSSPSIKPKVLLMQLLISYSHQNVMGLKYVRRSVDY